MNPGVLEYDVDHRREQRSQPKGLIRETRKNSQKSCLVGGTMGPKYDTVIAGASIAGASCAIALAPEGYRILLLDRAFFPRDKPCGEGIMPQGVQILAKLGLLSAILAAGGTKIRGPPACEPRERGNPSVCRSGRWKTMRIVRAASMAMSA